MQRNERWQPNSAIPDRVVVVEESRYMDLLISRRKLERLWDRPARLRDLETREIFVNQTESNERRTTGA